MSDLSPSPAFRSAMNELHAGRGARAEEIVVAAVRDAEASHGASSFEHAAALYDVGQFFVVLGDYSRACEWLRRAAEIDLPGDQGTKDHLTYLRNLGEILRHSGELEEAERVLRDGLERRRAFYGVDHAGYAFGLEPLAEVVWLRGDADTALGMIREAVETLWTLGNTHVFSALALRAFIHHDTGEDRSAFEDLPRPVEAEIDEIVRNVLLRADHLPDRTLSFVVLDDLGDWLRALRGEDHASLAPILAMIAECDRRSGDQECRQVTLRQLVALCRKNGDEDQAIKALQALALAHDEAGQAQSAEEVYREALAAARTHGDCERLSGVLRNLGNFLKDRDRTDEAEAILKEAVDVVKAKPGSRARGRGLVALGILVQHSGRPDEARAMLEEAVSLLPLSHADLLYARSHLDAIVHSHSCGCGDMGGAISKTLRSMVLPSLPDGLLQELRVEPGGDIRVHLARQPAPGEFELLQRVIEHARRELKVKIDERGQL